jgi:hypothetical protein
MGRYVKKGNGTKKPQKFFCEVCNEQNKSTLQYHHIIPRTDNECKDDWTNVCIICANCHNKVHEGRIKIIGILPSTHLPYKRIVVYEENGISNVPGIQEICYKKV